MLLEDNLCKRLLVSLHLPSAVLKTEYGWFTKLGMFLLLVFTGKWALGTVPLIIYTCLCKFLDQFEPVMVLTKFKTRQMRKRYYSHWSVISGLS
jgi:hypothetical protein